MATVKTAISLDKELFDQVESLAHTMKLPRSRIFALALEDLIRRQENRQLLDQLNQAYEAAPDAEEMTRLRQMSQSHRHQTEGTW